MLYLLLKTFKLYILLYSAYIVGWNKYQDACNAQENSLFKIFLSDIFLFFFFQETFSILFSKSRTSLKYSIREWSLMGEWINNHFMYIPTSIYLFKVKNENTRARCEICSKLKIRTPERHSGVFIVNFEHISHLVHFEHVNAGWVRSGGCTFSLTAYLLLCGNDDVIFLASIGI